MHFWCCRLFVIFHTKWPHLCPSTFFFSLPPLCAPCPSTSAPAPPQISYSLLNDRSGDYQFFRIDPELGSIYTEAVFDRETKGSYLLEVKSVDGWESARPGRHGQPNSGESGPSAHVTVLYSTCVPTTDAPLLSLSTLPSPS